MSQPTYLPYVDDSMARIINTSSDRPFYDEARSDKIQRLHAKLENLMEASSPQGYMRPGLPQRYRKVKKVIKKYSTGYGLTKPSKSEMTRMLAALGSPKHLSRATTEPLGDGPMKVLAKMNHKSGKADSKLGRLLRDLRTTEVRRAGQEDRIIDPYNLRPTDTQVSEAIGRKYSSNHGGPTPDGALNSGIEAELSAAGLSARGLSARGLSARGLSARGLSGRGEDPIMMRPAGGFIGMATIASLLPLIQTAAPFIAKAIGGIKKLFNRGSQPASIPSASGIQKALRKSAKHYIRGKGLAKPARSIYHVGAKLAKDALKKHLALDPASCAKGGAAIDKLLRKLLHKVKNPLTLPGSNPLAPTRGDLIAPLLSHKSLAGLRPQIVAALMSRRFRKPMSGAGIIDSLMGALKTMGGKKALSGIMSAVGPMIKSAVDALGKVLFKKTTGEAWKSTTDLEKAAEVEKKAAEKRAAKLERYADMDEDDARAEKKAAEKEAKRAVEDEAKARAKLERDLEFERRNREMKREVKLRDVVPPPPPSYKDVMAERANPPPSYEEVMKPRREARDAVLKKIEADAHKATADEAGIYGFGVGAARRAATDAPVVLPSPGIARPGRNTADVYRNRGYKYLTAMMLAKKR
jgi:hypothetical protein